MVFASSYPTSPHSLWNCKVTWGLPTAALGDCVTHQIPRMWVSSWYIDMHTNRIHQPANHGRQHVRRRSCSKHLLAHFLTASTQPCEKAKGIPLCLQQQRAYSNVIRSSWDLSEASYRTCVMQNRAWRLYLSSTLNMNTLFTLNLTRHDVNNERGPCC